ncbi:MAG TPA: exodeoxyribonuclease VII large subunit [bacterium]|nr:exodeoxyribonuclease VII large subunit [bacterium]
MMNDVVVPVSALVRDLKHAVEGAFGFVAVRGELTNLSKAYSGHIYFTLKDSEAQIKCALFKNQQRMNHAEMKVDAEYIVYGKLSVYEQRSEITLIANLIIPYGEGMAAMKLKMLKEKLSREGVFDVSHKKQLPQFPQTIGVVTSESGAAIHDIIKVSRKRFPPAQIILSPSSVQGREAHLDLIKALERISDIGEIDAIVIGRGGGAKEDLECFNSEELARAVIKCRKPVISAVGHETDTTILDLAASYSVSTPTAAAELIFPDSASLAYEVSNSVNSIKKTIENSINSKLMYLDNMTLALKNPSEIISQTLHRTEKLLFASASKMKELIFEAMKDLSALEKVLETNNPLSPMERGFAIVTQKGKMIKRREFFNESGSFSVTFKDGDVNF